MLSLCARLFLVAFLADLYRCQSGGSGDGGEAVVIGAGRKLGQLCYQQQDCQMTNTNSQCVASGLGSLSRCECNRGYVVVKHEGQEVCATRLYQTEDKQCIPCIKNEGVCYDVDGDQRKDGCQCQFSQSGDNCEVSKATVYCFNNTIQFCYTPEGDQTCYVPGHQSPNHCSSRVSGPDDHCAEGDLLLELPFGSAGDRKVCGTTELHPTANTIEYSNFVAIAENSAIFNPSTDEVIKMRCLFDTHTTALVGSLHFENGGNLGKIQTYERPEVTIYLTDVFGHHFDSDYTVLRPGDDLVIRIKLNTTGAYSGLSVEDCIASSSPSLSHSSAERFRFLEDGCPAPDQSVFTLEDNFRRVNGDASSLATGEFAAFQLSSSKSVFIHCRIDICTDAAGCPEPVCEPGRRRRSVTAPSVAKSEADHEYVDLVTTYKIIAVEDHSSAANILGLSSNFTIITTVLVLGAALLIFSLLALFLWKSRTVPSGKPLA